MFDTEMEVLLYPSVLTFLPSYFSVTLLSPRRAEIQAFTRYVSCMLRWVMCSSFCLIFTPWSNMKSILRSLSSVCSLSQV